MTREEVTSTIRAAKAAKKLTWQEIANEVGKSPVWTTSVCLGQNSMSPEQANKLVSFLGLPAGTSAVLQQFPAKGVMGLRARAEFLSGPFPELLAPTHTPSLQYSNTPTLLNS